MPEEPRDKPAIRWIDEFTRTKIQDGKDIREILDYEDISLWWFIDIYIYQRFVEIAIKDRYERAYSYIQSSKKWKLPFKAAARTLYGKMLRVERKIIPRKKKKRKVMIISYTINWRTSPDTGSKRVKKDAMIGDIIDKLQDMEYGVIALDQTTTEGGDMGSMIEKTLHNPNTWLPIEAYLSAGTILKVMKIRKRLRRILKFLESNSKFIEALRYDNIPVAEQLRGDFRLCFNLHLPKDILYLEMMTAAINKEKPDLILMTCEYTSLGLAATIAGRQKDVPTLAVQHGMITRYDRAYVYAKENISPDASARTPYHPIPDETAVYGQYYKDMLTEDGAYPKDSVVITGQPRYDILANPAKLFDREKTLKELGLDPKKKTVLWTTQSHGLTAKENKRTFAAVYNTLKELSDAAQLIVKLHPAEKDDQHKAAAKESGIEPAITKEANIYELIYACDLLITKHSTTALEAAALSKPVIVLNLGDEPDIIDYVKDGIAAGVYAEKELQSTIKKLLEDDSALAASRKKYLETHLYRIDGKASERVVELIDKMIAR